MDGDGGGMDAGGAGAMAGMDGDGQAAMNSTNGDRTDSEASVLESMGYTVDGSAGTAGTEGGPTDSGTSFLEYALAILGFLAVVFLLTLLYI